MSQSSGVFGDIAAEANADLSAKTYYIVKWTAANQCGLAAAATDKFAGVLQNKPKSGEAAAIRSMGTTKLVVDATTDIAVGDRITSDSAGKGIKTTTDTDNTIGTAMEAATADGDIIEVQLSLSIHNA